MALRNPKVLFQASSRVSGLTMSGKARPRSADFKRRGIETSSRLHRQSVAFREDLKACLVEQILDQRFVGNDEPERLRQTLAMTRDQEHLCIFFVKQNRGLGLGLAEAHQRIDESLAIFGVISPKPGEIARNGSRAKARRPA